MMLLRDLGLALAIGLLIGIERGWSLRAEPDGSRVAGMRTFALLGIAGGLAGLLGTIGQPLLAAMLAAGVSTVLIIGYRRKTDNSSQVGATTTIAALVTFSLGALSTLGLALPALVAAVIVMLLLSQRGRLHGWLRGMTETDVQAVVRCAIIAGAIWALLPD